MFVLLRSIGRFLLITNFMNDDLGINTKSLDTLIFSHLCSILALSVFVCVDGRRKQRKDGW